MKDNDALTWGEAGALTPCLTELLKAGAGLTTLCGRWRNIENHSAVRTSHSSGMLTIGVSSFRFFTLTTAVLVFIFRFYDWTFMKVFTGLF